MDPLYNYVCTGGHDRETLRQLTLTNDVNKKYSGLENETLLHIAARVGNVIILDMLIKYHKLDPEAKNKWGQTPLSVALRYKNGMMINDLVFDQGCDIDAEDCEGMTCLHLAAKMNDTLLFKHLISYTKDINALSEHMETPLMVACYAGQLMNVILLVRHGADTRIENDDGLTAWAIAVESGHSDIVMYLEEIQRSRIQHYIIGRFLHQKRCGIIVGAKICHMIMVNE